MCGVTTHNISLENKVFRKESNKLGSKLVEFEWTVHVENRNKMPIHVIYHWVFGLGGAFLVRLAVENCEPEKTTLIIGYFSDSLVNPQILKNTNISSYPLRK